MVGRRIKSWIAGVLSACLMLMSVPQAMAASTAPLPESEGVELLRSYGIVRGDETGNLQLDKQITRAEMSAIAVRAMGMDDMATVMSGASPFTDMKGYEWANGYVTLANQLGLVKGRGNGIFDPGASITYAEAYTIFLRMVQKEPAGAWNANTIVNTARNLGIAPSVAGSATANNPAIRGSVFGSLANAIAYVTLPTGKTILQTYVDPLPPTITLDEVPSSTMQDSVVISGSAGDAVSVTVNGKAVPLTSGRFSTTVSLAQGDNTITVVAVDRAGNSATKTVNVTYSFNVTRIEVKGTSQLKIGESTTITATAYTSDGKVVPKENVAASVSGGIGTYDKATGKFTAGSKAGEGAIVFKAGDKEETFKITVIDPAKAVAGMRIRFSDESMPYFIEGKSAVVIVEVIDKDGNVVTSDSGRKITLDVDGDIDVEDDEAVTKEGLAIFRIEADDPDDEVELTASSKGLKDVTLETVVATEDHIALVPEKTIVPADGKTKVKVRAYMRNKRGKSFDNDSGEDIEIELDIDADDAELDEDVVTIEDGDDHSDYVYVIAGKETETAVITGEFADDNDYDDLTIVPAVIHFYASNSSSTDDDPDEDTDKEEYDGYFELDVNKKTITAGNPAEITVSVVDEDGDLLKKSDYAFQMRLVLSGSSTGKYKGFKWDSSKDKLDELLDKIDESKFLFGIGGDDELIPLNMSTKKVPSSYKDYLVVGRTVKGECEVTLELGDFTGTAKVYVVGAKSGSAYDDEGDSAKAKSTTGFKEDSITITFK